MLDELVCPKITQRNCNFQNLINVTRNASNYFLLSCLGAAALHVFSMAGPSNIQHSKYYKKRGRNSCLTQ